MIENERAREREREREQKRERESERERRVLATSMKDIWLREFKYTAEFPCISPLSF